MAGASTNRTPNLTDFMSPDGIRLDEESINHTERPIPIREVEIHGIIGCSDSRDVGEAYNRAVREIRRRFAERGILVELFRENVAGTFVTPDVILSVKDELSSRIGDDLDFFNRKVPIEIYIHVLTHGAVTAKSDCDPRFHLTVHGHETRAGAPINCGMMHAQEVAEELEREILIARPTLTLANFTHDHERRREFVIRDQNDIRKFMEAAYGVRTLIAAGWVRSITDLRHHAVEQKDAMRAAFAGDEFKNFMIRLTAGVQNYEDNGYYRVDGNTQIPNTFMDQVFRLKQEMLAKGEVADHGSRVVGQKPTFGLFHHSSVDHPRATAIALHVGEKYSASSVFAIGSGLAARYERHFGRYRIVGFYYAVKHLGLKDWIVLGRDERETSLMVARVHNDPLISYVIQAHGVKLHPYSHPGLHQSEL